MTYVGAGMICPHIVNFSLLFGGILSWAVLWPIINHRAGDWYPVDATGSNLQGLYGYKVILKPSFFMFLNGSAAYVIWYLSIKHLFIFYMHRYLLLLPLY